MFSEGELEADYFLHVFLLLILILEEDRHILYTILTIQMGVRVTLVWLNLKSRKASAEKILKTEREQKKISLLFASPIISIQPE